MRLPTTNFSVPLSLCLLSYLTGCAAPPPVIMKPEIVRVEVPTLVDIPRDKLNNCESVRVPAADADWLDAPGEYLHVLQILDRCDAQISAFWIWYESQAENLEIFDLQAP